MFLYKLTLNWRDFNDFKQKILFSNLTCTAVTERLFSTLTKDFRKVASDMGHADSSALSLRIVDAPGISPALEGNTIRFTTEFAEYWWNLDASHQRQVRGVIAHEIAHSILKHPEKIFMKAFETLNIAVKCPEDAGLVLDAIIQQAQKASFLSMVAYAVFGIPFWKSNYFNSSSNESTKQLYADVTSLFQHNVSLYNSAIGNVCKEGQCINNEIEADLLTLKVPEYARGLIDFFQMIVLKCDKLYNLTYCDSSHVNGLEHPPYRQRITYMTDGLCEKSPGQNQDICQCSATDKLLHG